MAHPDQPTHLEMRDAKGRMLAFLPAKRRHEIKPIGALPSIDAHSWVLCWQSGRDQTLIQPETLQPGDTVYCSLDRARLEITVERG